MTYPTVAVTINQKWCENPALYQANFGIPSHNGLDFGGSYGTHIHAAHDGVVSKIVWDGEHSTKGNGVYLRCDDYETIYWHLSKVSCVLGQNVSPSDIIGEMGNSGFVFPKPTPEFPHAGTHLHFALRPLINGAVKYPDNKYNGYVDPEPYLKNMLKITGDRSLNRQYVTGKDGKYRWIYNETLLHDLSDAGIIDLTAPIDWKDKLDSSLIVNTWALIK